MPCPRGRPRMRQLQHLCGGQRSFIRPRARCKGQGSGPLEPCPPGDCNHLYLLGLSVGRLPRPFSEFGKPSVRAMDYAMNHVVVNPTKFTKFPVHDTAHSSCQHLPNDAFKHHTHQKGYSIPFPETPRCSIGGPAPEM